MKNVTNDLRVILDVRNKYVVFREQSVVRNGDKVVYTLKPSDVFVEPEKKGVGAWFGRSDLEKVKAELNSVHNYLADANLVFPVKNGRPQVEVVFPDKFENLPRSFKEHEWFGAILEAGYKTREEMNKKFKALRDSNLQESEIASIMTQSIGKVNEAFRDMTSTVRDMLNEKKPGVVEQRGVGGNPPLSPPPGGGYSSY